MKLPGNPEGSNSIGDPGATWHLPEGEYCYGRFNIVDIESNCKEFK